MRSKIFLLSMFLTLMVQGQNVERKQYIGLNVGGGLHTLLYSTKDGEKSMGGGGVFQVQYQRRFNAHWGLGAGLGIVTYHSSGLYNYTHTSDLSFHPDAEDVSTNSMYQAVSTFKGLRECQDMVDMGISLEGYFRQVCSERWSLELGLGVSLNVPLSMRYKVESGSYNVKGDFPYYNLTIKEMSEHGFTEIPAGEKGDIEHKGLNMGVQVDLGMLYKLKERSELYMGLYLNYQFLSSVKASEAEMFNASTLKYNNSLNSYQVGDVHPFMVGAKVGVRFQVGK